MNKLSVNVRNCALLLKQWLVGTFQSFQKKEYDHVHTEYGKIINASEISNGDDAIANVWNEYNTEQFPDTKRSKYQNSLLTDDYRKLGMSKNIYRNLKEKFQNHKWKHNVSPTFYHENIYQKT